MKKDIFFSVIIPVFNRPEDIDDLLSGLAKQTYKNFEVIIVESGSSVPSDEVVKLYNNQLTIGHYMYKNSGQGFSRNFGMSKAKGDYFVILDSDLLLDDSYTHNLNEALKNNYLDAFGGPDKAHSSFTRVQKAIDYTFTSVVTTGGIRGKKNAVGKFYPRSFNMGFSREVYEKTQGFKYPYFGEDIELSRRIMSHGFTTGLIEDAYVYHKRKNSFTGFFKQMFFFGRARIQIFKLFPDTLKITHFFPLAFIFYLVSIPLAIFFAPRLGVFYALPFLLYLIVIFLGASIKHGSILIGTLSLPAVFMQMFGYGLGFIKDFVRRVIFSADSIAQNKDNEDR